MAKRDSFLLRIDPLILQGIRQWSEDEMRSMNGQIEYLLRNCLQKAGRLPSACADAEPSPEALPTPENPDREPP